MADLQVKHVPEALHEKLRVRAGAEGPSLSQYVLRALERDVARPSMRDWLDTRSGREPAELGSVDVTAEIRAVREARDAGLEARISGR